MAKRDKKAILSGAVFLIVTAVVASQLLGWKLVLVIYADVLAVVLFVLVLNSFEEKRSALTQAQPKRKLFDVLFRRRT